MYRRKGLFYIGLVLCLITGCEQTFDPLQSNSSYNYTIYSVLDLSADTQWVRVMPVRNSISRDSISNDATVRLTRLRTGKVVVLEDSLFSLASDSYAWNFWTDTPLFDNEDYLIEAVSPEGKITSARASIPPDFSQPEIYYRENTMNCYIQIDDVIENIPVVEIEYRFRIQRNTLSDWNLFSISHINDIESGRAGTRVVIQNDIQIIADNFGIEMGQIRDISGELTVVSADSNWYSLDELGVEIPGHTSNVRNGLGLVTGIVSKILPYRPNREGQEDYGFCPPEFANE